jgi:hypothetical protein
MTTGLPLAILFLRLSRQIEPFALLFPAVTFDTNKPLFFTVAVPEGDGAVDGEVAAEGAGEVEGVLDGAGEVPKIVGTGEILGREPDGEFEGEAPEVGEVEGEAVQLVPVQGGVMPSCWKSH